jgi:hypothetical protein
MYTTTRRSHSGGYGGFRLLGAYCLFQAGLFFGLLFNPEDGDLTYSPQKLADFQWSTWCYIPKAVTPHTLHLLHQLLH